MNNKENQIIQVEELGQILHVQRREKGMTLEEVSKKTGVSASTLSRLERQAKEGKTTITPDMKTITSLAHWLKLPVENFLSLETKEEEPVKTQLRQVQAHLRASKRLDAESMELLANIMQLAWNQAAKQNMEPIDNTNKLED